ncbi:ribosomal protein L10-like protein [Ordospora colligata]|uniref:Ribosomal protein L10-like protein n=1 Tax=Ordospora colligata OC4 TaxID=1354746 RepID=A0A0B2UNA1_9MICR|nr:ribosomal protein L10-like protein [Ordospora colligata OC4]KHN70552.1 ribosomal protein L10-like protein [Ordospora colligata OC4]TBU17302.1 ribosomal protein L10-like protein [Ordospora colligata]TBU17552.1 ribosomal protein L10-like protein [Ordospora colligata]TBU19732.1 ribosomal protein L10-like protein [Ordospora colligata]
MGTVSKKNKERRNNDLEKIKKYAEDYPCVAFVTNPDLPNIMIKKMREEFEGKAKILFVKKKMASALYNIPSVPKGTYFLVFGREAAMETIKSYHYMDFLEENDVAQHRGIIEKQAVRNKNIQELLPVSCKDGQMQLTEDYVVCEQKDTIDASKAAILKFFGKRLKEKKLPVLCIMQSSGLIRVSEN